MYITGRKERKPKFNGTITVFATGFDFDDLKWFNENFKDARDNFTFSGLKSKGYELAMRLKYAIHEKDKEKIDFLLNELEKYRLKDDNEKTENEKWDERAMQMPADWGPIGKNKEKLKELMTKEASGRVLEAMSGFNSYFGDSENIKEVIALDFSEEALLKYSNPSRKRILFDLEEIVKGKKMDFFEDNSFNTIGVFFGIEYLTDVRPVYKEFKRILSNQGKILIVEGTAQGYQDLLKGDFNPEFHFNIMKELGFKTEIKELKEIKVIFDTTKGPYECEAGDYFLVKGIKGF